MSLTITTRGYKAPERLKAYLNDKMKRLDRFNALIMDSEAILSYEKLDQIAEFKIKTKIKTIIVKERSEDIFKSIDLGIDNVEHQVSKLKGRLKERANKKIVDNLVE